MGKNETVALILDFLAQSFVNIFSDEPKVLGTLIIASDRPTKWQIDFECNLCLSAKG